MPLRRDLGPLSGEIMAAPGGGSPAAVVHDDVVEAEFETLTHGMRPGAERLGTGPAANPGMDFLKGGSAEPSRRSEPGGPIFWAAGAMLCAGAFWVSGGHVVAEGWTNARPAAPFRIADLTSRVDAAHGRPLLLIDGAVANAGAGSRTVPPLLVEIEGDDGRTIRYRLDTGGGVLPAGESRRFSSSVAAPQGGVAGVRVTVGEGKS